MATQRDESADPDRRDEGLPPPGDRESGAPFLPEDSFLLDLDEEILGASTPADAAGDEFVLVDDDAVAEGAAHGIAASAAEVPADAALAAQAPAAPSEAAALAGAASAAAARTDGDDELASFVPMADELAPVDAAHEPLEAQEAGAQADDTTFIGAAGLEAAAAVPDAAQAAPFEELPIEELAAVAHAALVPEAAQSAGDEEAATAAAAAGESAGFEAYERPREPAMGAASEERALAFSGDDARGGDVAPVPTWLSNDDGDLPAFVSDEEAAEAGTGDASAPAAVEPLATVVPMPRRRRYVAAAGMVLAAALTAALAWELDRRGLIGGSEEPAEPVAVLPRPGPAASEASGLETAIDPAAEPAPAEEPTPAAEPSSGDPAVASSNPVEETPPPDVEPAAEPAAEPEPLVASLPPVEPAPDPAIERADPPLVESGAPGVEGPDALVLSPKRPQQLPGATRTRHELEGAETILQLENGHSFRGRISRVRGSTLALRMGAGEMVFDLSDVSILDSTAPEYRREVDMPEASVVLHNGQRLRGRLMKQTPEHVVLVVNNGQLIFPRTDVRDVSFTGRIHF